MAHLTLDITLDAAILDVLTGPQPPAKTLKTQLPRRDAALDPLLIAAAAASGPHVTRNHYHHDFYPGALQDVARDCTKWSGKLAYVSRQAPRRQRLSIDQGKENESYRREVSEPQPLQSTENLPSRKRRSSLVAPSNASEGRTRSKSITATEPPPSTKMPPRLQVKCMARTRIPTPHGPAFLHLYHNNRDNKEHLAIVVDPSQLDQSAPSLPPIRSRSLDSVWSENETEMDRIIRGAYVGRLSPTYQKASDPSINTPQSTPSDLPPPLIRIHSECFTGETVGSMRCDCGEQLDEAIRQISNPINSQIPGRGAVIYLRQEGRGIGLLSKIRAYNLQDMGHDTVTANLMLGHKADERGYEIAGAILKDLGLGCGENASCSESVRILTNNPDKMEALRKEGIQISERVPMIPRSWQQRSQTEETVVKQETLGLTLIGGKAVHGDDLDKYLRTKVVRMGHMLPLWFEEASQAL
ncbi:cyclohydrolase [Coprinopsis cinerea okayama7|uniref:GTP cyclohydrolase II n=1 Tax=Coprinopsis cinerea (strain Okayama-7 / 130 / ATCC MYA-4618 / FGSC 9003) TaxID=240176 RepID=A8NX34_COPC7|nr:cyclohydrolase [Coprinopsis cinerea okayama7\|eukprot:XP_001837055.1 cyclohydrolase [Coprinopsis cinerea okayama7\